MTHSSRASTPPPPPWYSMLAATMCLVRGSAKTVALSRLTVRLEPGPMHQAEPRRGQARFGLLDLERLGPVLPSCCEADPLTSSLAAKTANTFRRFSVESPPTPGAERSEIVNALRRGL